VFPGLDEPLRIGVSFGRAGDSVRFMSPGMVPTQFKPLLPTTTPPRSTSLTAATATTQQHGVIQQTS
jgi:hypothetical protein